MTVDARIDRTWVRYDDELPFLVLDRLIPTAPEPRTEGARGGLRRLRFARRLEDYPRLVRQRRAEQLEARYDELEARLGTPLEAALRYVDEHSEKFFLSEAEVAADVDDFIARVAARVPPVGRATADELDAAEAALGLALPPLLRRLFAEVGVGGWSPRGALLGLDGVVAATRWARETVRGEKGNETWPDELVPIAVADDIRYCVDLAGPAPGAALRPGGPPVVGAGDRPVPARGGGHAARLDRALAARALAAGPAGFPARQVAAILRKTGPRSG